MQQARENEASTTEDDLSEEKKEETEGSSEEETETIKRRQRFYSTPDPPAEKRQVVAPEPSNVPFFVLNQNDTQDQNDTQEIADVLDRFSSQVQVVADVQSEIQNQQADHLHRIRVQAQDHSNLETETR